MSADPSGRVLHLVPPNGGGVDRFVRDLCAHRPQDWILHVTASQCVVEVTQPQHIIPLEIEQLARLARAGALGRPAALHAHSTVAPVRQVAELLCDALEVPCLLTLHDVQFDAATPDEPPEHDHRLAFARRAARRTAPSRFILALARQALGESADCVLLPNGVDPLPASASGEATAVACPAPAPQCPVAVIGAIGPHKGLPQLLEVARQLPDGLHMVLLGYTDGQLGPGWLADGKIWVHGTFEPEQLPALACAYGARLAFFPRGQPESYCYALSDAWLAGLPALAPDWGAVGERLHAHGGGWLYPPAAPSADVARAVTQALDAARRGEGGVAAAAGSLLAVEAMVATLNTLYGEVAATPQAAADLAQLQQAAAVHLDSRMFRQELLRLQGDLAAARHERDSALQELAALARDHEQRGQWIAHVEGDAAALRQDLQAQIDELRAALDAARRENEHLKRWLRWPLGLLPQPLRDRVVRGVRRLLGSKGQ